MGTSIQNLSQLFLQVFLNIPQSLHCYFVIPAAAPTWTHFRGMLQHHILRVLSEHLGFLLPSTGCRTSKPPSLTWECTAWITDGDFKLPSPGLSSLREPLAPFLFALFGQGWSQSLLFLLWLVLNWNNFRFWQERGRKKNVISSSNFLLHKDQILKIPALKERNTAGKNWGNEHFCHSPHKLIFLLHFIRCCLALLLKHKWQIILDA